MAKKRTFAVGVDYGTNSVRTLVVDTADGREVATSVFPYPSGEAGILLDAKDPNLARQNPADYIDGFFKSVSDAVSTAKTDRDFSVENVVGVGVDTTGSTPLPVDAQGTPLAMKPAFRNNLAAQAWLWKDHTSIAEAAEITEKAKKHRDGYLTKCGGTYSSEWFWSKALHCKRTAPKVFAAAAAWVECADFVPAFITGNMVPSSMPRSICAAGHKAMYNEQWGGLPKKAFLKTLDPDLACLGETFNKPALPSDRVAGFLTTDVAKRVGLPAGIPVAVGAFDAHLGAVGAGIKPGTLVKIIGTSTCDMMVAPADGAFPDIPGLCGIVPGSIIPGMYGLEAGQSAVGDIFNWFAKYLAPCAYAASGDIIANLTVAAEKLRPGESGLVALDWNNGNRTILVRRPPLRPLGRANPAHHRAGNLPCPGRSHGLRRSDDHQSRRRIRRGGQRGDQLRRHRREEPAGHADLRRRLQPPHEDQPFGPDLCPERHDFRRGSRRRPS